MRSLKGLKDEPVFDPSIFNFLLLYHGHGLYYTILWFSIRTKKEFK